MNESSFLRQKVDDEKDFRAASTQYIFLVITENVCREHQHTSSFHCLHCTSTPIFTPQYSGGQNLSVRRAQ